MQSESTRKLRISIHILPKPLARTHLDGARSEVLERASQDFLWCRIRSQLYLTVLERPSNLAVTKSETLQCASYLAFGIDSSRMRLTLTVRAHVAVAPSI